MESKKFVFRDRRHAGLLLAEKLRQAGMGRDGNVQGRRVIVVDDGMATGSTMLAAVQALRSYGVADVTVAVSVLPRDVAHKLMPLVDALICIQQPQPFIAVGHWYEDFRQLSDDDVMTLLAQAQRLRESPASIQASPSTT